MKRNFKKTSLIWGVALCFISFFMALVLEYSGALNFLEMKSFDERISFTNKNASIDPNVVVAMVDEASLQALEPLVGRWPWPRSIWAEVLSFLESAGAKAVLFDILFTEPQVPRNEKGELGSDDLALVAASSSTLSTTHAFQLVVDSEDEVNKTLLNKPLPKSFASKYSIKNLSFTTPALSQSNANNYYLPFKEIYESTHHVGVVEFASDTDGIYRHTKLIRRYHENSFPTLSLSYILSELSPKEVKLGTTSLTLDQLTIPLQQNENYYINLKNNFENFSISGILATIQQIGQGKTDGFIVDPASLQGKVVLIGASAVGIDDLKASSLGQNLPGVYLHASIISNILKREFIQKIPTWITLLMTFLLLIITIYSVMRGKGWIIPNLTAPILIIIYLIFSFLMFRYKLWWLSIAFPIATISLGFITSFIYMTFTEKKEKSRTRKMLGQYVSPEVLTEVMDQLENLNAEVGKRQSITVFFSDIRGFTTFSEKYPCEQVVEQLNYYLTQMIDIVFEHKGTLDKFIGDAVMAFWGAPVMSKDHALNALKSAVKMRETMPLINTHFASKGYEGLQIGMGINTGDMIVGNIGSDKKLSYTVIGDHVNLGSRLESLTKSYHLDLIISETTYEALQGKYPCIALDRVRVKGKNVPITLYYPLSLKERSVENIKMVVDTVALAFQLYQEQKWHESENLYNKIMNDQELNGFATMFIERINYYKDSPPEKEWDGCFTMKTK